METVEDGEWKEVDTDSDPTYEAWKRDFEWKREVHNEMIPILPTRHGNQQNLLCALHLHHIPILPTRHGNSNTRNK